MDLYTPSSQKIENMLRLSLSLEETQRERAAELEVGFDQSTSTWELIVKYNGNLLRYGTGGAKSGTPDCRICYCDNSGKSDS